jgi:iron complex outermembrane receptor protein
VTARAIASGCALVMLFVWVIPASAAEDLLDLSLEELMNIEVTSVSKKAESKNETAASVHVITAEDIRRGGFTSVPEALRVVPGVQVSRIDASRWAISIRGFRQEFSNSLLVMIDGRPVYTPLFGGVIWSEQNLAMQDVERIEVVRGPGGAIWGANAVNGVINIITRHSSDTQGGLLAVHGGTQEYGLMGRYGAKLGEDTTFRLTARGEKIEDFDFNQNYNGNDEWSNVRVGLRSDTKVGEKGELTLHADYFDIDGTLGVGGLTGTPPSYVFSENDTRSRGGDILIEYARELDEDSSLEVRAFYDTVNRRTILDAHSHTFDLDAKYDVVLSDEFSMVWGAEYRYWTTHTKALSTSIALVPNDDDFHLGSAFVQFELDLFDDLLKLVAGTKLSGNSWSGFEYQPSGRFVVAPAVGHTLWGAVSRAVRTPTHIENDLSAMIGPISISGDRNVASEELLSYELGYRFYGLDWLTTELSLFYSRYEDVTGLVGGPLDYRFDNPGEVTVGGGEVEVSLLPTDGWKLTAGYSVMFFDEDSVASPLGVGKLKNTQPRHQFVIRSVVDLPADLELDASGYYVDGLSGVTPTLRSNNVRQYFRLDLRLGWKPLDWLEVALVGQNLTDARHAEFNDVLGNESSQVPRSGYAMVTVDF